MLAPALRSLHGRTGVEGCPLHGGERRLAEGPGGEARPETHGGWGWRAGGLEGWIAGPPGTCPRPGLLRSLGLALLTTVALLFAAEGGSLASWHLRCCHGNNGSQATAAPAAAQRAELQSQVLSSPACSRDGPQVSTPARAARPRQPHPVLTLLSPPTCTGSLSHLREPRPSWVRPRAPSRPPGQALGPQALLGQTPHLPSCYIRPRHRAGQGRERGDAAIGQGAQRKQTRKGLGPPCF